MAKFLLEPHLKKIHGRNWVLASPLVYKSDLLHKPESEGMVQRPVGRIIVPQGFESDLASIPSIVPRFVVDPNGHSVLPALVHDYLCRTKYEPRYMADKVFLEAMAVVEPPVRRWRRWPMFAAVRILTFFKTGK